jgi:hypothetical protein
MRKIYRVYSVIPLTAEIKDRIAIIHAAALLAARGGKRTIEGPSLKKAAKTTGRNS